MKVNRTYSDGFYRKSEHSGIFQRRLRLRWSEVNATSLICRNEYKILNIDRYIWCHDYVVVLCWAKHLRRRSSARSWSEDNGKRIAALRLCGDGN